MSATKKAADAPRRKLSAAHHVATEDQKLAFGALLRESRVGKFPAAEDMQPTFQAILEYNGYNRLVVSSGQIRAYETARSSPRYAPQVAALEMTVGVPSGTFAKMLGMPVMKLEPVPQTAAAPTGDAGAAAQQLLKVLARLDEVTAILESLDVRVARLEHPTAEPAEAAPRSPGRARATASSTRSR